MTKAEILALKKSRLARLMENPKDIKCPGVIRKLNRQVRNLSK